MPISDQILVGNSRQGFKFPSENPICRWGICLQKEFVDLEIISRISNPLWPYSAMLAPPR